MMLLGPLCLAAPTSPHATLAPSQALVSEFPKHDANWYSARKAAWVHIPKCGSSFGTTIAHWLDEAGNIPSYANVSDYDSFEKTYNMMDWAAGKNGLRVWTKCRAVEGNGTDAYVVQPPPEAQIEIYSQKDLETLQNDQGFDCNYGAHLAASADIQKAFKGHFMGFFRDVNTRVRSAYQYFGAGCTGWFLELLGPECWFNVSITEFAKLSAGSVTKQVTGQAGGISCNECVLMPDPSTAERGLCSGDGSGADGLGGTDVVCDHDLVPDTMEAIKRLDDFSFIGDTDDWANSMCLFHLKMGGDCLAVENLDSNPTVDSDHTVNSTALMAELADWEDPYDTPLVAEALKRYEADKVTYGVNDDTCRSLCSAFAYQWPKTARRTGAHASAAWEYEVLNDHKKWEWRHESKFTRNTLEGKHFQKLRAR